MSARVIHDQCPRKNAIKESRSPLSNPGLARKYAGHQAAILHE